MISPDDPAQVCELDELLAAEFVDAEFRYHYEAAVADMAWGSTRRGWWWPRWYLLHRFDRRDRPVARLVAPIEERLWRRR